MVAGGKMADISAHTKGIPQYPQGDLGLVGVDEDLGVAERTTATITADNLGLCPADGLSVNELDSGIWLRLKSSKLVLNP
jgi:hypothetical protein